MVPLETQLAGLCRPPRGELVLMSSGEAQGLQGAGAVGASTFGKGGLVLASFACRGSCPSFHSGSWGFAT